MELADRVVYEINSFKPDAVFVDAGRGEGVIDRVRQLGYQVTEVNFGARAINDARYLNKRAEMWDSMKKWLEAGGCLYNVKVSEFAPDFTNDLITPAYGFTSAGKMKLEEKDKIKERVGRSPDLADALALTFAAPVRSSGYLSAHNQIIANIKRKRQKYSPVKKMRR
jgi:hypothetical protein